jgi:glycerol kinase
MPDFILALDQGTTSSRAIVFDRAGSIKSKAQREVTQHYPHPGWVQHDPHELWATQAGVVAEAIAIAGIRSSDVACLGITNQRETTILWDRKTGEPICPAIVWQDRRTSEYCDQLKERGLAGMIQGKTGLVLDPYFSATKLKWMIDNIPGARQKAQSGGLAFGTVDCWLVWKMTAGGLHITDATNASRTLLFNIHTQQWDGELLELFEIPEQILPRVVNTSEIHGETAPNLFAAKIPIAGIAGDQQAALFGQMCLRPGMVKHTYGTGGFMVLNTGGDAASSHHHLLTTVAWQLSGKATYALEGSIFIAGAVVQWLRDGLGLIRTSGEVESLAQTVPDNGGIFLVPAFSGLGAPHWDPFARGTITGLTRGTTSGHLARAALESIAYQTSEVLDAMKADSSIAIQELRVDGGATVNDTLMQFQADILGIPITRPKVWETAALGAACLAGLATGFWKENELEARWTADKTFEPQMDASRVAELKHGWRKAVDRSKGWLKE